MIRAFRSFYDKTMENRQQPKWQLMMSSILVYLDERQQGSFSSSWHGFASCHRLLWVGGARRFPKIRLDFSVDAIIRGDNRCSRRILGMSLLQWFKWKLLSNRDGSIEGAQKKSRAHVWSSQFKMTYEMITDVAKGFWKCLWNKNSDEGASSSFRKGVGRTKKLKNSQLFRLG